MSEKSQVLASSVAGLVERFQAALADGEWSTREHPRTLRDEHGEPFQASSLFLSQGPTRLVLDPTGDDIPGADAVADLYLTPDFATIASFSLESGVWKIHSPYPSAAMPHARPREWGRADAIEEAIRGTLEAISQEATLPA